MKSILLASILGIFVYTNSFSQNIVNILEIKTESLDSTDFIDGGTGQHTKYVKQMIEADKLFIIRLLKADTASVVSVSRSPTSKVHKTNLFNSKKPFTEEDIEITLKPKESVEYEVKITEKGVNFFYQIELSTEQDFDPNSNFIFLSAIRSVAGKPQNNEFFDLNLKFNYLGRYFTLFGLDLSLAPADSGQLRINEGLLTVNRFIHKKNVLETTGLKRAFFFGIGTKIFNQLPYVGGHIGSIEIDGPLFSSYALLGYYRNAYGRYAEVQLPEDPVQFRNNIYSEFTLAFDNKKNVAGILSDIRIKLGMMFPFTNSVDDIVKPIGKDIQYRLVLEVPIGGIYKF